jgi:hypothetical protein
VAAANAMPGGHGGHEEHVVGSVKVPIHTVHKHHYQKVPEYKIVKVPVVKEVKVPVPYKVPIKIPYPVVVKQDIHAVPVHKYPVHSSEHIHHGHGGGGHGGHGGEIEIKHQEISGKY